MLQDLLVLLDLLGTPRPSFFNYFKNTEKWYLQLASAEKRLDNENHLKKSYNEVYFNKLYLSANIEDDHLPFIRKGTQKFLLLTYNSKGNQNVRVCVYKARGQLFKY